ncbi:hypothetical protein ACTMU2_25640 [Cupriavidus basilensis]
MLDTLTKVVGSAVLRDHGRYGCAISRKAALTRARSCCTAAFGGGVAAAYAPAGAPEPAGRADADIEPVRVLQPEGPAGRGFHRRGHADTRWRVTLAAAVLMGEHVSASSSLFLLLEPACRRADGDAARPPSSGHPCCRRWAWCCPMRATSC